jgi:hypothetical protein
VVVAMQSMRKRSINRYFASRRRESENVGTRRRNPGLRGVVPCACAALRSLAATRYLCLFLPLGFFTYTRVGRRDGTAVLARAAWVWA